MTLSDLLGDARSELAATTAALAEMRRLRTDRVDDDEHDPEGSPLSAEWARLDGLRRVAARRLVDVEAAIAHSAAGRYGICARCSGVIAAGRLEALPTATRCVHCA
ncbi:MAG: TraR/DksA C4-type zinc finger protein [Nakamurella sp.]